MIIHWTVTKVFFASIEKIFRSRSESEAKLLGPSTKNFECSLVRLDGYFELVKLKIRAKLSINNDENSVTESLRPKWFIGKYHRLPYDLQLCL